MRNCWNPNNARIGPMECDCPRYGCLVYHSDRHECLKVGHIETCKHYNDKSMWSYMEMISEERIKENKEFWDNHEPGKPIILNDQWILNLIEKGE